MQNTRSTKARAGPILLQGQRAFGPKAASEQGYLYVA